MQEELVYIERGYLLLEVECFLILNSLVSLETLSEDLINGIEMEFKVSRIDCFDNLVLEPPLYIFYGLRNIDAGQYLVHCCLHEN